MAKLTITIHMDNAAFKADPDYDETDRSAQASEVCGILQRIIDKCDTNEDAHLREMPLCDTNGNTVGQMTLMETVKLLPGTVDADQIQGNIIFTLRDGRMEALRLEPNGETVP